MAHRGALYHYRPMTGLQPPDFATLLGGQDPGAFLDRHWQRQPKLIRGAWPNLVCPLDPDDLAGLACEPAAEARLVVRRGKRWQVRHGPFTAEDFAALPARNWTLLVQAVDAWVDAVAAIGDGFDFLPAWRRDDVMMSYAAPGGGVGPHVDQYDVFLLQGLGRRHWRWGGPVGPLIDGAPLRLMNEFRPTDEAVLAAGDMLYLPPGTPHDGVGLDRDCLTLSIGFRAPAAGDLFGLLADALAGGDDPPLPDVGRAAAVDAASVDAQDVARTRRALGEMLADDAALTRALGQAVTEPRRHPDPPQRVARPQTLHRRLAEGWELVRDGHARLAHAEAGGRHWLFVNGVAIDCPADLAARLAGRRRIDAAWLGRWAADADALALIRAALLATGALRLTRQG